MQEELLNESKLYMNSSSRSVKDFDHDDMEFADGAKEGLEKLKAVGKLLIIIFCYAASFISLIQFGFWMAQVPQFHSIIIPTDLFTWIDEKWKHGIWWDGVTRAVVVNSGLLLAFGLQHTVMSQRVLDGTTYWIQVHYVYKIDRPIYVLATAIVLQGIVRIWQPVPVMIWTAPFLTDYFKYAHVVAWISLYGTSLMLDLPDMVGFNQVVISTPNVTSKSPDLQMMYRTQRHMGFVPFLLVLLIHPSMTLDRFILSTCTLVYTYVCWRSPTCYQYACQMKTLKRRRVQ